MTLAISRSLSPRYRSPSLEKKPRSSSELAEASSSIVLYFEKISSKLFATVSALVL